MAQKPLTILVADDDEEDLELIEDAIMHLEPGAELHKLSNGNAVIEYLALQPDSALPCLIILDYNMPELNGSQVLSQICKHIRYEAIPKVILSTSSAPLHIHECMSNGATEYFVKPNNIQDLNALAEKMLALCQAN
jgi:CheY-like chemotaxis protein